MEVPTPQIWQLRLVPGVNKLPLQMTPPRSASKYEVLIPEDATEVVLERDVPYRVLVWSSRNGGVSSEEFLFPSGVP